MPEMPCSEIAPCSGGLNQSKHPELGPTESPDRLRTELTFSSLFRRLCLIIIPSYIQPTLCSLLGLFTCINSFAVPDTLESTQGSILILPFAEMRLGELRLLAQGRVPHN